MKLTDLELTIATAGVTASSVAWVVKAVVVDIIKACF